MSKKARQMLKILIKIFEKSKSMSKIVGKIFNLSKYLFGKIPKKLK